MGNESREDQAGASNWRSRALHLRNKILQRIADLVVGAALDLIVALVSLAVFLAAVLAIGSILKIR